MKALVITDGSCITGRKGERHAGGWAAIIERGSDGWVERGRTDEATSTQMELRAAIEGLRVLGDRENVELRTDCMAVLGVYHRWFAGEFRLPHGTRKVRGGSGLGRAMRSRDWPLWVELAQQFERLQVTVELIVAPERKHRRAHMIAQAEARAANNGVAGAVPLPPKREPRSKQGAHHKPGCTADVCVINCSVRRRRLRSEANARARIELAAKWRAEYFAKEAKPGWGNTDYQLDGTGA